MNIFQRFVSRFSTGKHCSRLPTDTFMFPIDKQNEEGGSGWVKQCSFRWEEWGECNFGTHNFQLFSLSLPLSLTVSHSFSLLVHVNNPDRAYRIHSGQCLFNCILIFMFIFSWSGLQSSVMQRNADDYLSMQVFCCAFYMKVMFLTDLLPNVQ